MDHNAELNLTECLETARDIGVLKDQAELLTQAGYIPLPWQWLFHKAAREADKEGGPVDIGLGGARGPGKSHAVLSQVALDDCQRFSNLKGLFLRQTGIAAKESFDDLIDKVVVGHVEYERTANVLKVGDNCKIVLGGFKDEKEIDKYVGIEYDFIIVEELNQLTEEKYTKLRGSLRTSKPDWRPRMYVSFNPGGIGHQFVRSRYVIPHRSRTETKTRFVPSTYKANPYLNAEYIDYLEGLEGDLGKAWREGDWDTFSGQAFPNFGMRTHSIDPFIPRKGIDLYLSMDWGYSEKSAFAAYAHAVVEQKSSTGEKFNRIFTFHEWYGNLKTPHEWAEIIANYMKGIDRTFVMGYCDPAMFNTQTDGSVPISELMTKQWEAMKFDCQLAKGNNNRINKVATMHNWISVASDGLPYWLLTTDCHSAFETIPTLQYDENRVDDINTDGSDHSFDSISYMQTMIRFTRVKAGNIRQSGQTVIPFNAQGKSMSVDPNSFWTKPKKIKTWKEF